MADLVKTGIELEAKGADETAKNIDKVTGSVDDLRRSAGLTIDGLERYLESASRAASESETLAEAVEAASDAMDGAKTGAPDSLEAVASSAQNASGAVDGVSEALQNLSAESETSGAAFSANMEEAADKAAAAFMNAIAFIGEVNAAIIAGVNEIAEKGDAIEKGSRKIGISTEAYQEWSFVLERSGSSMNKAQNAIETLTRVSRTASDKQAEAFGKLGISMEAASAMAPEELFSAVITGLQNVQDEGERSVLANQLLGGSYKNLGVLLETSASETEALRQKAHELGLVMSEENVAAAAAYQDSIDDFSAAIEGAKTELLQGLMPALTAGRNGLTEFIQDVDWDALNEKLSGVYDGLLSGTEWLLDHGDEVVAVIETVGGAWLAWKGTDVVMKTLSGIKDIYGWLEAVGGALGISGGAAAGGLGVAALSIATIVDHVGDLRAAGFLGDGHELQEYADNVNAISQALQDAQADYDNLALYGGDLSMAQDTVDMLQVALAHATEEYEAMLAARETADAAGPDPSEQAEQTAASAEAAAGAAQQLSEAGETIQAESEAMLQTFNETAGQIVSDFAEGTDEMSQTAVTAIENTQTVMDQNMAILDANAAIWGQDMMRNLANGILEGANSYVVAAVESVASAIEERLGFSEPEVGPLAKFHTFAPDMMALFAQGIREGEGLISSAVGDVFDLGPLIAAQSPAGQIFNYGGVSVVIYGAEGQSADELYDVFSRRLASDVADREAVFSA